MLTTRSVSGLLFVINFVFAAIYLDALMGLILVLFAYISTFVIWNADILATTKTDHYVKKFGYFSNQLPDQSIIIDKESPPGCVSALGWLYLVGNTIYTVYLVF